MLSNLFSARYMSCPVKSRVCAVVCISDFTLSKHSAWVEPFLCHFCLQASQDSCRLGASARTLSILFIGAPMVFVHWSSVKDL